MTTKPDLSELLSALSSHEVYLKKAITTGRKLHNLFFDLVEKHGSDLGLEPDEISKFLTAEERIDDELASDPFSRRKRGK